MSILSGKTILILTAGFGAGHVSAANAIKDSILKDEENVNIVIRNFIDASVPKLNKPMVKFYENNTKYTPELYNCYYYLKKSFSSKYDIAHKVYTPKLSKFIEDLNPDLIISTFPLAAACVNNFRNSDEGYFIPAATVITDVVDSMEWIFENTELYFVPSIEIKNRFMQRGISPDKVEVVGVPISSKFRVEEKEHFPGKYRIIILGGGRGLFDISEDFMRWIDEFISTEEGKSLEVTIVTGTNKKLYNNLTEKDPLQNIKVLGYVNNMDELLKSHDLMMTKPGGATLFEAIYTKTPLMVKIPRLGQEIENGKFIIDKGIGLMYSDEKDLREILKNIASGKSNSILSFMNHNIEQFRQTIYPENIALYLEKLLEKYQGNK
ncbi:MGDG synthase family glycosyltransferase [Peptacetobacter sp.]|uniref:MGDG synthase family glycosyltransferase n=1 Tax=Peptacetobacter sp. TaxID=2991975 RepID=UPI002E7A002D|nr:glycosyltransferase [Peptacetobacter sp.]MEE0450553.1 glycosyltransferase [Peptacetobacter sp.]